MGRPGRGGPPGVVRTEDVGCRCDPSGYGKGGTPLSQRLLAVFGLIACAASFGVLAFTSCTFVQAAFAGAAGPASATIFIALVASSLASGALFALLAARLFAGRCLHAERLAWILVVLSVLQAVVTLMLYGLTPRHAGFLVQFVVAATVASYFDPLLAHERARWRERERGTTGGFEPPHGGSARNGEEGQDGGHGFVKLNFFNLFWVFFICSIAGLAVETAYHFLVVQPGHYQDRAGLLFGPFSPIYGFGAVLMTVALNRFHGRSVVLIFLVSAVIGGAFEFVVSWIMQFAFGLVAWDYSGTFLSIDGRTNGMFMAMWGVLGVLWVKLFLPLVLRLVRLIPWRWRYGVTAVCAALLLVDGIMTVQSVDCWYEREAGAPIDTPVVRFYAEHFDDAYMQSRFQSMSMHVHEAARVDR